MRNTIRVIYAVVIIAGAIGLGVAVAQTKRTCISSKSICFKYKADWKVTRESDGAIVKLTKAKPGAVIQIAAQENKITGSVQGVASALDAQLRKQLPAYKLIEANQLGISKIRSVELSYSFTPKETGRAVRQQLVVVPIGNRTYYISAEMAPADFGAVKPDVDYLLSHTEIKY
jgi:hypothetical protein